MEPSPGMTKPRRDSLRWFYIQVTAVLVVFMTFGFVGLYLRTESLLSDQALAQARSYVDLVVTTRAWNAHYEGVYVEKKPGVETNPFLLRLGLTPDITTSDGRVLTMRNPAIMTREVSDMLLKRGGAAFSLTSLNPVNPANSPDAWERTTLKSFTSGTKEAWTTDRSKPVPLLRYMRPLFVESTCMACHASQGYRVGDIRGGVSVSVPLTDEVRTLRENALWLTLAMLGSTAVLLGLTYLLIRRLSTNIDEAEANLVRLASTDELTGLWNRRQTVDLLHAEVERARREDGSLSVTMIDVDHFKNVNDELGHAAGDAALREVAARIAAELRPYDTVGRFGGEEFLVVTPGVDLADAVALAERIRASVAAAPLSFEGRAVAVTLSAGVGPVRPEEARALDRGLARADRALYRAKSQGRDCVVAAGPQDDIERVPGHTAGPVRRDDRT
jgi:diguanylate cyclase (GGDEF)-like protein